MGVENAMSIKKWTRVSLTEKETKFVFNYLTNGENASKAMIDAGYKESSAYKNSWAKINEPKIKNEIERMRPKIMEQMEKLATEEVLVTVQWKMEMLKETAERCRNGDASKEGLLHPAGIIAAIAELNKMQGHYSPERTITTNMNVDLDKQRVDELINETKQEF